MKVVCTAESILQGIASASALEIAGNKLLIFGDDARDLFVLDQSRQLTQALPLPGIAPGTGRIPKHEKPDIEAAFSYAKDAETHVIAIGSGSSGSARDRGFHVRVDASGAISIRELSLTALYDTLRQAPQIGPQGVLNLEGAALTEDHVVLAQRAAGTASNYLIRFERGAFINWIESGAAVPSAEFFEVNLKSVNGVEAGLTGLTFSPAQRRIYFTAAVEDRPDPVQDGPVLGSFVGAISWPSGQQALVESCESPQNLDSTRKLESICVVRDDPNEIHALAVADDDHGSSQLAELQLILPPQQ